MKLKSFVAGCSAVAMVAAFSFSAHADVIDPANISYILDTNTPAFGHSRGTDDPTGDGLADGVIATKAPVYSGDAAANAGWVEFAPSASDYDGTPIHLTVDLGAVYDLDSLTLTYFDDSSGHVQPPAGLQLKFSDDGTFDSAAPVDLNPFTTNLTVDTITSATADLTGYSGRYVDVGILMGTENWLYATELSFSGTLAAVPEPATLGLLSLGGLILAGRRRGRKAADAV